jgi:hypothetical protein
LAKADEVHGVSQSLKDLELLDDPTYHSEELKALPKNIFKAK